jgi:transposase
MCAVRDHLKFPTNGGQRESGVNSDHEETPMAGKRKVYTPEFKLAAVKMITEQKLSVAEVARRLGVTENRLHDWKKALATKGIGAFPGSGHLTPLEEENRKLRAEVKRLEAERDILKKARPANVTG